MFQGCKSLCLGTLRFQRKVNLKCMSSLSKSEAKERRNALFSEEKKKQIGALGRIEKVHVKYISAEDEVTLVMNKNISTPNDCAKHISEGVTKVSALALVNGMPWDMNRPFTSDCELKLISLKSPKIGAVNTAFWRTCSLMLGAVAESAFKSNIELHLHSFPSPNIQSGSFVYDVHLDLPNWQPSISELRALSSEFVKLANQELLIERLEVTPELALEMFQDNPFKVQQIPDIAEANDNNITLYRLGNHIDISKGPMVGNTYLVGRVTVASVHKFPSEETDKLYRFQGIALPKGILLNHFAYSILEERARKLNNTVWMPHSVEDDVENDVKVSAQN